MWQTTERADSGRAPGTSRPSTMALNFSRSSPAWMASKDAPIISTPYLARTPPLCSATAVLRAVWPPRVARMASGRSLAMTNSTNSGVIGSM